MKFVALVLFAVIAVAVAEKVSELLLLIIVIIFSFVVFFPRCFLLPQSASVKIGPI